MPRKSTKNDAAAQDAKRPRIAEPEDEEAKDFDSPDNFRRELIKMCIPCEVSREMEVVENLDELLMSPLEATIEAAQEGDLERLQHLLGRSNCWASEDAAVAAGVNGHLEALQLLFEDKSFDGDKNRTVFSILDTAADEDFGNVVEFLVGKMPKGWEKSESPALADEIIHMFEISIEKNFVGAVKTLTSANCITYEMLAEALVAAASRGHLDMVECLFEQEIFEADAVTAAFTEAAKQRRTAVVKFLYEHQQASPKTMAKLLKHAAKFGQFPIASILINSPLISQETKNKALMTIACSARSGASKFIQNNWCWTEDAMQQAVDAAHDIQIRMALLSKISS